MKQTVEIEVPDGKKAVWKDGTIIFEDIHPKLPKTWEEFCEYYPVKKGEYFINSESVITETDQGYRLYRCNRNILPSKEAAEQHLAQMQLHYLRDCYRQGWLPDWNDSNQYKYVIYICKGRIICDITATISRFLAFQSREIAEEFLNNFKDLIKEARDLI